MARVGPQRRRGGGGMYIRMTTSFAGEGTDITKNDEPIVFCQWKEVERVWEDTYMGKLYCI
jgi:hypothetical protein